MGHLTVTAERLLHAVQNAAMFTSDDEARPILRSVLFDWTGEQLTVWATDSYAAYREHIEVDGDAEPFRVTVSADLLPVLTSPLKILSAKERKFAQFAVRVEDGRLGLAEGERLWLETMVEVPARQTDDDHQYPDVASHFADAAAAAVDEVKPKVCLNAEIVGRVGRLKFDDPTGAAHFALGPTEYHAMTIRCGTSVTVLIMPIRVG